MKTDSKVAIYEQKQNDKRKGKRKMRRRVGLLEKGLAWFDLFIYWYINLCG